MMGARSLAAALLLLAGCAGAEEPVSADAAKLAALAGADVEAARAAVDAIVAEKDTRYVGVLIELLRASEIRILHADGRGAYTRALEALTGKDFGPGWPAWVAWYAETDLAPPPGFTGWKGELLGRLDPIFAALLPAGAKSTIRVEEIVWGGVAFDGIPALDRPPLVPAAEGTYLDDDEPVFGIEIAGDARAYPLRILDWHEMTNDVVGGVPVSLAYCTLCGAGIAYDGRASDGQTYDFGSSGFLMRSNKLMYDRQTRSLWNQFTGKPVVGPLVGKDVTLKRLPVVVARWAEWRAEHPDTRVLSLETGHERPYHPGAAYASYFASPDLMFPVSLPARGPDGLDPKKRVFGLLLDGAPKAYPVERVVGEGVVNDAVGDAPVVVLAPRAAIRVDGNSVRHGPATYDAGAEVRAYARSAHTFVAGTDAATVRDGQGRTWRVTEDALVGPDGERAERLPGHLAYWFGWRSFFPRTLLYGAGAPS